MLLAEISSTRTFTTNLCLCYIVYPLLRNKFLFFGFYQVFRLLKPTSPKSELEKTLFSAKMSAHPLFSLGYRFHV